jgi:SAM-dependent MidA family methyltransferase
LDWVKSAARALNRGFILIIDYGFPRDELYSPLRTEGTLAGYYQHQRLKDVLQRPGEIDITAHIDFSAIAEAASSEGCAVLGFTDQHHFMVGAAERRLLEIERLVGAGSMSPDQQRFLRGYKSLMHPNTMGLAFKYLLLGKGVAAAQAPTGFKYAKDPAPTLRLRE